MVNGLREGLPKFQWVVVANNSLKECCKFQCQKAPPLLFSFFISKEPLIMFGEYANL